MQGDVTLIFYRTPSRKLFHEFIEGNYPILMQQMLGKFSCQFQFAAFPRFVLLFL